MADNKKTIKFQITGLSTILGIVFLVLKLANVIDWAWVWVLAPFWIPASLAVLVFIIAFIITVIAAMIVSR